MPKQTGLILRSTGSWYEVRAEDGGVFQGRLKGKFKLDGPKTSNPLAVGDRVGYEMEDDVHGHVTIVEILPRENYILRKSVHKTGQGQVLAANIDQVLLVFTYKFPRTSLGFIDRFLVSAEAFRIPVQLVFNKMDLLDAAEREYMETWAKMYQELGYGILFTSTLSGEGMQAFNQAFEGKVSLMAGHSGVGKSSLLNAIAPHLDIKTQAVSSYANKGVHTTTFATMWELRPGAFLIDSPGIKELGLMDIAPEELGHYFPEMRALLGACKYHNCQHVAEPGCAVKAAYEEGRLAPSRFQNYLSMLANEDNRR